MSYSRAVALRLLISFLFACSFDGFNRNAVLLCKHVVIVAPLLQPNESFNWLEFSFILNTPNSSSSRDVFQPLSNLYARERAAAMNFLPHHSHIYICRCFICGLSVLGCPLKRLSFTIPGRHDDIEAQRASENGNRLWSGAITDIHRA